MILPLILGTVELAAKLAPIVAQAVVDVIQTVHEHARKTPAQASAVGLPMREVLNQRRQEDQAVAASRDLQMQRAAARGYPMPGRS